MKRMHEIETEVIQAIKLAGIAEGRVFYQFPPEEIAVPFLVWYRAGTAGHQPDGEWVERETAIAFELYSDQPLDTLEESVDATVDAMKYHATKEQSADVPPRSDEMRRFRRRLQYRFYWNF